MKIFMWASVPGDGFECYGRGECRWTMNVAKTLLKYGHHVTMFPSHFFDDIPNARFISASLSLDDLKEQLKDEVFDLALFLVDSKTTGRHNLIKSKKYVYGELNDSYIKDFGYSGNDCIVRWNRPDLPKCQESLLIDRSMLLAQPMVEKLGKSKFMNRRIAWTTKYSLSPSQICPLHYATATRFFRAMISAAKKTDTSISIFNTDLIFHDTRNMYNEVKNQAILNGLSDIIDVKLYPYMNQNSFNEELSRCSIVIPVQTLLGGWNGALAMGLVPVVFKDTWLADHPEVVDYSSKRFGGIITTDCSEETMHSELVKLLTDMTYYNETLNIMQKMAEDNTESAVMKQIEDIANK